MKKYKKFMLLLIVFCFPPFYNVYAGICAVSSRGADYLISYETLFLKNRFSDLKSILGYYSEYDDMDSDGKSIFITNDKFKAL